MVHMFIRKGTWYIKTVWEFTQHMQRMDHRKLEWQNIWWMWYRWGGDNNIRWTLHRKVTVKAPGTLLKSIRNCNSYDSNWINRCILRRKLINKGFSGCSLRFTTGKNSGKIDKNIFVPQNDPGARCLWALTETGLENSPILEGNKPPWIVQRSSVAFR